MKYWSNHMLYMYMDDGITMTKHVLQKEGEFLDVLDHICNAHFA